MDEAQDTAPSEPAPQVNSRPRAKMAGTGTFHTFAYLLNGARSLELSAADHATGSGYCRIAAVVFSAFSIEAHLNHIGEPLLPYWGIVERRASWENKLDIIALHLKMNIDYGRRPFQTVRKLFKFRDRLAHGNTVTDEPVSFHDPGLPNEPAPGDPSWLSELNTDDQAVSRAVSDAREAIAALHAAAGLKHSIGLISSWSGFEDPVAARLSKHQLSE